MRSDPLGSVFLLSIFSRTLLAQPMTDAMSASRASGVCAPFGAAAATMTADGTIRATCS